MLKMTLCPPRGLQLAGSRTLHVLSALSFAFYFHFYLFFSSDFSVRASATLGDAAAGRDFSPSTPRVHRALPAEGERRLPGVNSMRSDASGEIMMNQRHLRLR